MVFKANRNNTAGNIAYIAGIILLIGGFVGSAKSAEFYNQILGLIGSYISDENIKSTITLLITIFTFFAMLGAIAVLIGGYFLKRKMGRTGKFLITLGVGFGIIDIILGILFSYLRGYTYDFYGLINYLTQTLVGLGVLLSIIARVIAK